MLGDSGQRFVNGGHEVNGEFLTPMGIQGSCVGEFRRRRREEPDRQRASIADALAKTSAAGTAANSPRS